MICGKNCAAYPDHDPCKEVFTSAVHFLIFNRTKIRQGKDPAQEVHHKFDVIQITL